MEVLVAVAIIGIAMPALLYSVMQRVDGTGYMRDRMIASWVASNQLSQAHLRTMDMDETSIDAGTNEDTVEMAGENWTWSMNTELTNEKFRYQVHVNVWRESDPERFSLSKMTSYLYDFRGMREEIGYVDERQ